MRCERLVSLACLVLLALSGLAHADCERDLAEASNAYLCERWNKAVEYAESCLLEGPTRQQEILALTLIVDARLAQADESSIREAARSWNDVVEDEIATCDAGSPPLFSNLEDPRHWNREEWGAFGPTYEVEAQRALAFSSRFEYARTACDLELAKAVESYREGRWLEVVYIVRPCVTLPSESSGRIVAYALLAMSYLARDQEDKARIALERLTFLDRDFDPELELGFVPAGPELQLKFERLLIATRRGDPRTLEELLGIGGCEITPRPSGDCRAEPVADRWVAGFGGGFFRPDPLLTDKDRIIQNLEPVSTLR